MSLVPFSFQRSTPKYVRDKDLSLKLYPANEPAFSFDENGVFSGMQVEEAVTNRLLESEDFTTWTYTPANIDVLSNVAVAPNGLQVATKIQENASTVTTYFGCYQILTLPAGKTTFSVFAKADGRDHIGVSAGVSGVYNTAVFNLNDGSTSISENQSFSITPKSYKYKDGWWRCEIQFDLATGADIIHRVFLINNGQRAYTGVPDNGAFIFGAMSNVGGERTYVPSGSTQGAHGADFSEKTGITQYISPASSGGSVYFDFGGDDITQGFLARIETGNTPEMSFFVTSSNNLEVKLSGSSNYVYNVPLVGDRHKVLFNYSNSAQSTYYNGALVDEGTVSVNISNSFNDVKLFGFSAGLIVPNLRMYGAFINDQEIIGTEAQKITSL